MSPLGRYVLETVLTLIAISGLALFLLYVARRSGMGRPLGPLALSGRLVLDARRAIYLVRVGDVYFVVGASEAGLTKLGELSRETLGNPPEAELAPPPRAFRDLLQRLSPHPSNPGSVGDRGKQE